MTPDLIVYGLDGTRLDHAYGPTQRSEQGVVRVSESGEDVRVRAETSNPTV